MFDSASGDAAVCAESFTEFLYRFWIENEIWFKLADPADEPRGLTPEQLPFSPASKIRRPRAPRKTAPLLPAHVDELLLACARTSRDRLALLVLLDCGVRRAELAGIRIRDFDLARQQLTVFGKGQKERVTPLRGRIVMA
jgi:integrase